MVEGWCANLETEGRQIQKIFVLELHMVKRRNLNNLGQEGKVESSSLLTTFGMSGGRTMGSQSSGDSGEKQIKQE